MTTPQHSSQIWMRLCVLPLLLPICVALLACAAMFSSPRNRNGIGAPKAPMPGGTSSITAGQGRAVARATRAPNRR
jgi:hypothetical protein